MLWEIIQFLTIVLSLIDFNVPHHQLRNCNVFRIPQYRTEYCNFNPEPT